jgi:hypothetical protein
MFFFGHLGLGRQVAKPFQRNLPTAPLLFGAILPDLIDKPLYYGLSACGTSCGSALEIVSGTRSFGHTVLFTVLLAAAAGARRSRAMAAVALGCATHLFLDVVTDAVLQVPGLSLRAFLWPLYGVRFPAYRYRGLNDHLWHSLGSEMPIHSFHAWYGQLGHLHSTFVPACEVVGAALLIWEWRRNSRGAR